MTDKQTEGEQLSAYRQKRNFDRTQEPFGSEEKVSARPLFVVQKHAASHLHYDFRLEIEGVLKSWAVPKGPSLNPKDKRLAVLTEDHPLEYAGFEGIIPDDEYGAGAVIVWDSGYYEPLNPESAMDEAFKKGHLEFRLEGQKLKGAFVLLKTRFQGKESNWLLIKKKDEQVNTTTDVTVEKPCSIISQKTIEEMKQSG